MSKRADPERDARIIALYESGMTCLEVAQEVGMKEDSVLYAMRRLGVARRRGMARLSSEKVKQLSRMGNLARWDKAGAVDQYLADHEEGMCIREIAERHGVSRQAVHAALKRAGRSTRPLNILPSPR